MIELQDDDDIELTYRLECDPELTKHLGGPVAREKMPGIFERRRRLVSEGKALCFRVMADGVPAGSVLCWDREDGTAEMGWMILKDFQGRGLATAAARLLLEKAKGRFPVMHATPAQENLASNAICRKLGFQLVRELEIEHHGARLRCNDWRLAL